MTEEEKQQRREKNRARHARESTAKAGRAAGGVSREYVRLAGRIQEAAQQDPERFGHLYPAAAAGTVKIAAAMREITGDERKALYVKLQPGTYDWIAQIAAIAHVSKAELLEVVVQAYRDRPDAD